MKFPDPTRVSEWIEFKPGLCDGCRAGCCELPVECNVEDLIRLGATDEDEASRNLGRVAKRLKNEGLLQKFDLSRHVFILNQQPSGECLFLDENRRCEVYEDRPEVCREFPKIGPKPGYCPAAQKN